MLLFRWHNENTLIYDNSYKTLTGAEALRIRFDKIHEFIRVYDETRYLTLFGSEKYDVIYNRIWYLVAVKSDITNVFSHYHITMKVNSDDSLPIEKTLTLQNVIILISSVLNKDQNYYYDNILLK